MFVASLWPIYQSGNNAFYVVFTMAGKQADGPPVVFRAYLDRPLLSLLLADLFLTTFELPRPFCLFLRDSLPINNLEI